MRYRVDGGLPTFGKPRRRKWGGWENWGYYHEPHVIRKQKSRDALANPPFKYTFVSGL